MFTHSTGNKPKSDNLTKWTIIAALYIAGWSLAFFIAWIVLKEEPGILEGCILAPGVVELVMTAVLKLGKNDNKMYKKLFDLLQSGNVDEALTTLQNKLEEQQEDE